MIRVAICDDELLELSRITKILNAYFDKRNVAFRYDAFSSSIELLETIREGMYDVVMLDVLMPGMNGMQTAHEIRTFDHNTKIIFLTSSPEYAVESYVVDAYYYLLKPATETKLYPLLDKLLHEVQRMEDTLHIKSASGIMSIPSNKLEYLEVMNKKLYFHLIDGSIKEIYGSLSDYEAELLCREEFIKVHRSFIVNMGYIQELSTGTITTASKQKVSVSRLLYSQVRETYMKYLFYEKGVE